MKTRRLVLPNDIETIPQLNEFIDSVAEEVGLDMSLTMSLNLAIEEAVVNVMEYAYPEGQQGDVEIEVTADQQWMTFVITDTGIAFDPTKKEDADTTLSAEERPIGGLGIFMVRQLMDVIDYKREDNKNVLTLQKKLVCGLIALLLLGASCCALADVAIGTAVTIHTDGLQITATTSSGVATIVDKVDGSGTGNPTLVQFK